MISMNQGGFECTVSQIPKGLNCYQQIDIVVYLRLIDFQQILSFSIESHIFLGTIDGFDGQVESITPLRQWD